uniref:Uncharacterized protein n=1 Tax=Arundo donax TaxID=35708 RepID=A0A0A9SLD7_ARUDO
MALTASNMARRQWIAVVSVQLTLKLALQFIRILSTVNCQLLMLAQV